MSLACLTHNYFDYSFTQAVTQAVAHINWILVSLLVVLLPAFHTFYIYELVVLAHSSTIPHALSCLHTGFSLLPSTSLFRIALKISNHSIAQGSWHNSSACY